MNKIADLLSLLVEYIELLNNGRSRTNYNSFIFFNDSCRDLILKAGINGDGYVEFVESSIEFTIDRNIIPFLTKEVLWKMLDCGYIETINGEAIGASFPNILANPIKHGISINEGLESFSIIYDASKDPDRYN